MSWHLTPIDELGLSPELCETLRRTRPANWNRPFLTYGDLWKYARIHGGPAAFLNFREITTRQVREIRHFLEPSRT